MMAINGVLRNLFAIDIFEALDGKKDTNDPIRHVALVSVTSSSRRSFVHWTVSDKAKVLLHHQAVQVALQPNGGIGCPETRKPAASGPFYVLQIRYSKG
ncbi:hypothetical protein [Burkholderia vietnamiensis]|uniref:hypothetical protein n=1 Tax=Burkholderia vietnamiensis TaxID=60552 RepID=UPI0012DB22E7|nr:hypothetical protein [Burkholderia vietnamiensis]